MKTKPILFSTSMVQAIQEGRKTQTRRIIKGKTDHFANIEIHDDKFVPFVRGAGAKLWPEPEIKPKYRPGDIMWVRETFALLKYGDVEPFYGYKADGGHYENRKWKPSIFMPKEACRLFLKVTNVRVERLHDISEEDAVAEGVSRYPKSPIYGYKNFLNDISYCIRAKESFRTLWKSINGQESWKENPFVWVYDFERVERPLNFA